MEEFYTRCLGFVVTDRGDGKDAMIFLSRNPDEHHQLVLNPGKSDLNTESPIDHISFRVDSISSLRVYQKNIQNSQKISPSGCWAKAFRQHLISADRLR